MTFEDYQKKSRTTALYPSIGHPVVYPALGLGDEAGEVLGKIKKLFRDDQGELTLERKADIKKELGDVLWYLTQVATELDISLEELAEANLEKLLSRKERGALTGDGDNR